MKTSEVLRRALELFGPNGEYWVNHCPDRKHHHCAVTAIRSADATNLEYPKAWDMLKAAIDGIGHKSMTDWNDRQTSFAAIESAFKQAIATAERGEG